jgi:hypothetical protein
LYATNAPIDFIGLETLMISPLVTNLYLTPPMQPRIDDPGRQQALARPTQKYVAKCIFCAYNMCPD